MSVRIIRSCRLIRIALILLLLPAGCARGKTSLDATSRETAALLAGSGKPSRIQWTRYYEALGVSSRTQRRFLMLYFSYDSCDPCAMMEKWTFTDERVLQALEEFVPVKIKGDVELQIVRRFGVQTFPMIIFVETEEGEIDKKAGYRDAAFLLRWIDEVKDDRTTIRALEKELERRPEDLGFLLKQARNYVDADEVERAFELARKAADVAPGNANVLALFGLCYLRLNKMEAAEAAVAAALETDEQNEEGRRLKITILLRKAEGVLADENYARAAELFSDVLEFDPENFDARMGLGRAHTKAGETDMAFAMFQQAASVRPNSPVPHVALGELYQQESNDAMAEEEYVKATELEPRYEPSYFRLMELYERNGRRNDLMETFEKVLLIEPAGTHNEIAWLMATSDHTEIFDPEAAVRHADAAIELEPHPWYIDTLAEAYYAQGEYELAIAIIKEAIAKEPEDIEYYRDQLEKFQKANEQASSIGRKKD